MLVHEPRKVPNQLNLLAMPAGNQQERRRYAIQRANHAVYSGAARLWSHGVPMQKALSIIREAVHAARGA